MRTVTALVVVLASSGCVTATVSRTMMIPLQPPDPAAFAPNEEMFASAYGAISALPIPIDTNSGEAVHSDTGDQVAGVQPDLGGMFRVAKHVLVGGNLFASPSSTAVKATNAELQLNDQLLFGFRTRVGFGGELDNHVGLITAFGWGFDFLPYKDGLSGSSTQLGIAASLTAAGTYRTGFARIYLGATLNSQPTISKTVTTCGGCSVDIQYDWQLMVTGGAKLQVAPTAALIAGVSMPVLRDRIAWTPVFTAGFVFDFVRPVNRDDAELPRPPPRPPLQPVEPPPPPPL